MPKELICAFSYSAKRLGAAIYDEDEKEVKMVADMAEDADFIVLGRILRQFRPSHVLANRSQDEAFQMQLRTECNYSMSNSSTSTEINQKCSDSVVEDSQEDWTCFNEQTAPTSNDNGVAPLEEDEEGECINLDGFWQPSLNFLPNVAFSFGLARKRLEQIFGGGDNDKLAISFRFDLSSSNMIRSLGALFRFLEQQKAAPSDSGDFNLRSCINGIDTFVLEDCVQVDSVTLRALEIFYSDYNPKSIRQKFVWGNHRREGMSIFKLCNLCRSVPGKQMLRMWFERPSKDRRMLEDRHEAIAYLYQDCNLEVTAHLRTLLKDVCSVRTLCTLVKIGTFFDDKEVNLAIVMGKLHFLGDPLKQLTAILIEVIDFSESSGENRLVICKGVDPELDQSDLDLFAFLPFSDRSVIFLHLPEKELYEKLPEDLTSVARMEAEDIAIESCSVAYVPIIGYLLMAPENMEIPQQTKALVEILFSSEGMTYYKTKRMRLLDENIGDIKMQIVDAETNIVLNLQRRILESKDDVLKAVDLAATLDCLVSLSVVARKYNWVRPKFVEETTVAIEQARHPIAEHICKNGSYVANPVISSNKLGKVKVLSGPNASGKSIYLKMVLYFFYCWPSAHYFLSVEVGSVVYLACCGSFVPAQRATIGPINRILSRLYTIDSVLDGMSSSDEGSLLIIDEFGKGTMTEVGLALLASCLNYWLEGPAERCPHVFISSHFHALCNLLRDPNKLLRFETMDVRRLDDDTLDFLYSLVDGTIDLSYATFTALKMGIPRDIVDRSEEVYIHLRAGGAISELEPVQKFFRYNFFHV
uniref:DNA mismatch repair proteins mutS family domain-containing protein n=1 Tax=Globodera rostochiensis TaxID=31243 RepID=A0A914GX69_GLORO